MVKEGYQEGFEAGLALGLRTALIVVRDAGPPGNPYISNIRVEIEKLVADMKEVQASRERREAHGRPVVASDLFLAVPLAHPGDFGFPATEIDEGQVAISHMRMHAPSTPVDAERDEGG